MDDPHKYGKRKSNNEEQNKVSRKTFPRYIAVASLKFKFQDFFICLQIALYAAVHCKWQEKIIHKYFFS